MARNGIQFQHGLSLDQFLASYGTEVQCEAALTRWRWPDGFVCPHCRSTDHAVVGKRRLYLCHGCRRQTSLVAGTIFSRTQLPLTRWFQAMWLITQSKDSISTLSLSRQIGVKWDSAWLMRQKLAEVMIAREAGRKLEGRIEVDDAVMGGKQLLDNGGKPGRAGSNKIPFVIAVETRDGPIHKGGHNGSSFTWSPATTGPRSHASPPRVSPPAARSSATGSTASRSLPRPATIIVGPSSAASPSPRNSPASTG